MHVGTVTCRFDPALGTFDDAALRLFTRDKVVLAVRDPFTCRARSRTSPSSSPTG